MSILDLEEGLLGRQHKKSNTTNHDNQERYASCHLFLSSILVIYIDFNIVITSSSSNSSIQWIWFKLIHCNKQTEINLIASGCRNWCSHHAHILCQLQVQLGLLEQWQECFRRRLGIFSLPGIGPRAAAFLTHHRCPLRVLYVDLQEKCISIFIFIL